jgi:DNA-binding winged helix-turn-helix (wHTH) protein/tetratricopeptide (TPR) repeat protein
VLYSLPTVQSCPVQRSAKSGCLIRFGVFELDLRSRELRKKGLKVKLQQQPLDLLQILLERRPDVVTREELRERLWPADVHVDFDRSLNKAVVKLREALGDYAESPRFVETMPRFGYRFIAPAATDQGPLEPMTSIAVLPFLFLGEVEDRKAFSLGFADALITTLGSIEDIAVLPTSAVLNCVPGTDPTRTCRDLGVRHVLQGNVQKLGSHWRVSTQLFDSTTQKITYSENHDFVREDVFEVQDEIGFRVAESLQTRLPRAVRKARDRYSSDPEALEEFMAALPESYSDREEVLLSAARHLSRAVERDPGFALAHATLSYVAMHIHWEFDSERAWLDKAEYHCGRALALDPALPEGHSVWAFILWSPARNFQHADAIAELEQVLAAQPNNERAHNRMAAICWHIGRFEEARIAHQRARCSNPKTRANNLEFIYLFSGDFARAEEAGEAWIREKPGARYALWFHPLPALMLGHLDAAEQRLAVGLKLYPDEPLIVSAQGMLHARRNERSHALECVRRTLDSPRSFGHTHHAYHQIACVYAVLGDSGKAMAWLERSVDTGNPCWPFFRVDPFLDSLREEPKFQRLVADLEREHTALKIQRL